jgi:tripartite-type tricarboxylate transporter receptor subunit TctC
MTVHRRHILRLAGGAVLAPMLPRIARADTYPSQPVRIIVGFAAGGANDIIGRILAQFMTEKLGKPFIVENKPGAAGNIAAEYVAHSQPDGYTLLMANAPNAINQTLYTKLNFSFVRDTTPVGGIMTIPNVMEVTPSLPVKTVKEFIDYAKAHPDTINMGIPGVGSSVHVSGELFKMLTGVTMQNVSYRGSAPMLTDLISGRVNVTFDNLPASIEHIRAGRLRALAVTTAQRAEALPDVPTIGDTVPGYEANAWFGIVAPTKTPSGIIATLNKTLNDALADPKLKVRLAEMGGTIIAAPPDAFGKLIAEDVEKWAKVIKFANLKAD